MTSVNDTAQFLLCIAAGANPVSLEVRKVYRTLPDSAAEGLDLVRVIDESGEDYLYPKASFVAVDVPQSAIDLLWAVDAVA